MTRNGGRILVDQLELNGVGLVSCVPGESYLAVLDALHDSPIRLISCRHEGAAANMAEACGKLTGRPGVCLVTRGPGATHASVGVHTAAQDSTPLLLLVGQVPREMLGREAFQEMDYEALFGSVAKWVGQAEAADQIPELVSRAFAAMLSGRPGPAVLALPEDVLFEEADVADAAPVDPPRPAARGPRPGAPAGAAGGRRAAARRRRRGRLERAGGEGRARLLRGERPARRRLVPLPGLRGQPLAGLRGPPDDRPRPGARPPGAGGRPARRRRRPPGGHRDARVHAPRRPAAAPDARPRPSRPRRAGRGLRDRPARSSRGCPSSRRHCEPSSRSSRAGRRGRKRREPTTWRTSSTGRCRATSTSASSWPCCAGASPPTR